MADSTESQRDAVIERARDTEPAAALARAIDDPVARAEALAWVARFAEPVSELLALAREALDAAGSADAAQEQVQAACPALAALAERGAHDAALEMVEIVLHAVPRVATAGGRAKALVALHDAVGDVDPQVRKSLLFALVEVFDGCSGAHPIVDPALAGALARARDAEPAFVARVLAGIAGDRQPAVRAVAEGPMPPARVWFF